jgi:hypothetical protein
MDLHDEIANVAYELFERDGRRDGKDKEHWCEAEEIVRARHAAEEKKAETRNAKPVAAPQKAVMAKPVAVPQKAAAGKTRGGAQKEAAPKGAPQAAAGRAKKTGVKERAK